MRSFTAHGRESVAVLDGIYKVLYSQLVKDVVFVGSACDDLRSFPVDARQRAGYQPYLVQAGLGPTDWRPMASVGPGCREIRVRADTGRLPRLVRGDDRRCGVRLALLPEADPANCPGGHQPRQAAV